MDGFAEIALRQARQIVCKLHRQGFIQTKLGAELAAVGAAGGFAQHDLDRVARHQMHQQKGQQQDAEYYRYDAEQALKHAAYP